MSDNLCGPSNALKSFGEHVDRDRSLQQDRLTGTPHGGPAAFRTARPAGNGDQDFRNFAQSHGPVMGLESGPAAHQPELAPHHLPYVRTLHRGHRSGPLTDAGAALDMNTQGQQRPNDSELGPIGFSTWATEFSAQNNGAAADPGQMMHNMARVQPGPQPGMVAYGGAPMQPQMAQMGAYQAPFYQPSYQPFMNAQPGPGATFVPPPPQAVGTQLPPGLTPEAIASIEAQFAQLSKEYGDFENEMGSYMAQNGPTQDERATARAEAEDVDAEMERIADELDRQRLEGNPDLAAGAETESEKENRRAQGEIVQTAQQILDSVADNNSDKFAKSSFLTLMRQITAEEVVLMGDDFVNVKTGQPIAVQVTDSDADTKGKGKAVESVGAEETPSTK